MKGKYRQVSLSRFCRLLGVTRQAYYQHFWHQSYIQTEHELIIKEVKRIREKHRYMGTRKLYEVLQPFLCEHFIKIGRDALFDLLAEHRLLVRRKKRRAYTTNSFHRFRKYPNIIKDFVPSARNQLWVSDITYWKTNYGFAYISLITDAFSHKIVGYHVADTMETIEVIKPLKMALSGFSKEPKNHFQLIHHSDRGLQYCSNDYVDLLNKFKVKISMTENSDPLENAIAERINGILKQEYLEGHFPDNIEQAKEVLQFSVEMYNAERPHMSIGNLTPSFVHEQNLKTEKLWKNYYQKI